MNLEELTNKYVNDGYVPVDAMAKVCQDIILFKVAKSSISRNVTIKGGVVIMGLSNDSRRATRDLDLDFIKYSLEDDSIRKFISKLNNTIDKITISIISPIERLNHQEYDGKRILIRLSDEFGNELETKIDIGVHKNMEIEQDEFYFDLTSLDNGVSLLVNSKEQIFTEKLKSLLKFGGISTRYKDIFDFYYLINMTDLNKERLLKCFDTYILNDKNVNQKNLDDIHIRLKTILSNKRFIKNLSDPKNNWLDLSMEVVIDSVLEFFETLEVVQV